MLLALFIFLTPHSAFRTLHSTSASSDRGHEVDLTIWLHRFHQTTSDKRPIDRDRQGSDQVIARDHTFAKAGELPFQVINDFLERGPGRQGAVLATGQLA